MSGSLHKKSLIKNLPVVVVLVAGSFLFARLLWGAPPAAIPRPAAKTLPANPANKVVTPAPIIDNTPKLENHASEVGLQIFGAIVQAKNPLKSVVLIKIISNSKTFAKKIGDVIEATQKFTVLDIQPNYIDVKKDKGSTMRLFKDGFNIPIKKSATPVPAAISSGIKENYKEDGFEREKGNITMSSEYRSKMLDKDLPNILMQASAEPVMDASGNIMGFMLDQIEAGSIYEKSGIQNGDIIKSINGEELNNIQATVKLLHTLKSAENIDMEIDRKGTSMPFSIKVQK
jgi:type II secretory pathway component PulC